MQVYKEEIGEDSGLCSSNTNIDFNICEYKALWASVSDHRPISIDLNCPIQLHLSKLLDVWKNELMYLNQLNMDEYYKDAYNEIWKLNWKLPNEKEALEVFEAEYSTTMYDIYRKLNLESAALVYKDGWPNFEQLFKGEIRGEVLEDCSQVGVEALNPA